MTDVKWVPVEERLPETSGEYLVFISYDNIPECGYPYLIRYSAFHKAFNAFDSQDSSSVKKYAFTRITHWAEIPCPPEGWRHA